MADTPTPADPTPAERLAATAESLATAAGRAAIRTHAKLAGFDVVTTADGDLVLNPAEARLYRRCTPDGDELVDFAEGDDAIAAGALAALGRLRRERILDLVAPKPPAVEGDTGALTRVRDTLREELVITAADLAAEDDADGTLAGRMANLADAYVRVGGDLEQGHPRHVELEEELRHIRTRYTQVAGALARVVAIARGLGGDTFEGRLEELGKAIGHVAETFEVDGATIPAVGADPEAAA